MQISRAMRKFAVRERDSPADRLRKKNKARGSPKIAARNGSPNLGFFERIVLIVNMGAVHTDIHGLMVASRSITISF
jgi:hypothetical protein